MARRRLSPLPATDDAPVTRLNPGAPIAAQAASASRESALEEIAAEMEDARASGRMVLDLPLDAIDIDHLARDRVAVAEDEDLAALKASIAAHGQRQPIEVTPKDGKGQHGLISGWRRLTALQALAEETGDAKFATIRALVRQPGDAGAAYVAMVEENEVRLGLSYFERARIAALAVKRGVFATEKQALLALYATASRPKRSRIRSFLTIVHTLDGVLAFPTALGERLGLKLAEALQGPDKGAITAQLRRARPETAEAEQALIARLIAPEPSKHRSPEPRETDLGRALKIRASRKGRTLTVKLTGEAVNGDLEAALHAELARWGKAQVKR